MLGTQQSAPRSPMHADEHVGVSRFEHSRPCCDARALAGLTRAVIRAPEIRQARHLLVRHAAELLGAPAVALTRRFDDAELGFVAVTGEDARLAAKVEQRLRQGPGWEAHATRRLVFSDDVAEDVRWGDYRRAIAQCVAFRSVLALPLVSGGELLGALVAYSTRPGHFTPARLEQAELLAAHGSAALGSVATRIKARNLEVALRTNREIATAVGIVMNRFRLREDDAFSYLRELSQRRHRKLSELADRIVETGEIPTLIAG